MTFTNYDQMPPGKRRAARIAITSIIAATVICLIVIFIVKG